MAVSGIGQGLNIFTRAVLSASVGIYLSQLYQEMVVVINESSEKGDSSSSAADDAATRQAEYDVMYRLTRMPPEPGGNCSSLAKNIHHTACKVVEL